MTIIVLFFVYSITLLLTARSLSVLSFALRPPCFAAFGGVFTRRRRESRLPLRPKGLTHAILIHLLRRLQSTKGQVLALIRSK
ncbi:hypothetical protein DL96DRAFT_1585952 [Flagelloscypha sp. PMI_526]|nr:hypothetical protein DL96DRAFT_1585952 [Flagelloscypha sp. PMI_526]